MYTKKGLIMQHTLSRLFPLLLAVVLLCGCTDRRTRALEEYRSNMAKFYDNVASYDVTINAIDASSDSAVTDLLAALDALNAEFQSLRGFTVPEEFSSISDLTIDAADSMDTAVRLYHEAYEGTYDAAKEAEALTWYERANRCIQIILQVLHGETPTGDDIRITY